MNISKEEGLAKIEELKKYVGEQDKKEEKVIGIAIKNRFTGSIIFQSTKTTYKEAVIERLASGADLRGADLRGADLCGADLRGADLCGADLCGADLYCANLRNANLRNANLCNANLRNANLCDANLRGANLCGAELMNAKFYGKGGQGNRVYSVNGKSVNLSTHGGGGGAKTGLYLIVPEATKKGYAVAVDGDSVDLSFPNSKTRRGRVGNKAKNLMTSNNIGVFTKGVIRKLTTVECERLQSLPDRYTEGISENQRYTCLGNAFNVDVISHILSFIK